MKRIKISVSSMLALALLVNLPSVSANGQQIDIPDIETQAFAPDAIWVDVLLDSSIYGESTTFSRVEHGRIYRGTIRKVYQANSVLGRYQGYIYSTRMAPVNVTEDQ